MDGVVEQRGRNRPLRRGECRAETIQDSGFAVGGCEDGRDLACIGLGLLHRLLCHMESPTHTSRCCASAHSAEASLRSAPAGLLQKKGSRLPAPPGFPPNLRAPAPTFRSRLHTMSSDSPENQAAVIAAKPKAVAQHPPNRLVPILQQHVTAQARIDSSRIHCPGNKTAREAQRGNHRSRDPRCPQCMSRPSFGRAAGGRGTKDRMDRFILQCCRSPWSRCRADGCSRCPRR